MAIGMFHSMHKAAFLNSDFLGKGINCNAKRPRKYVKFTPIIMRTVIK